MCRWSLLLALLVASLMTVTCAYGASGDDDDGGTATVVESRGPADSGLKVRNKFFRKKGRVEFTPNFGYITNNAFNQDFTGGLDVSFHLSERFAIEVGGSYAFLGGSNQKDLSLAVLKLTPEYLLEATDPGAFIHAGVVWSPMYGKINPMGLAVINLDFFLAAGVGYLYEEVEMLTVDWREESPTFGNAVIASPELPDWQDLDGPATFRNHLFAVHLGFGVKIFASRGFSLRIDGRFYLAPDRVLDFKDDAARVENDKLQTGEKPELNRLDCHGSDAFCVLTLNSSFVVSIGGSIWVPKMRSED